MGPPLSWPYSQTNRHKDLRYRYSVIRLESCRGLAVNLTFALVLVQLLSLHYVRAGPVVFNMEYSQGPVPLARNIRHLPCISRRTGDEGLCMFAIDCLKANGTHLGTCIDRFYFGSCCQIPDKTILPILTNHIDDNSIDGASFVHPQTDKIDIKRTTTEKATTKAEVESKTDETTLDNKIDDKKEVTEAPVKLSTFQTVSGDVEKETETSSTLKPKPTRRPTKPPTYTRPTHKPYNITRPQYTQTTYKPKPTKPIVSTRKPPYRPPPKRPSTKKPLPLPPRLNITIIPQSTSSKPHFTKPQFVITYINTTNVKDEPIETTVSETPTTTVTTTEKLTTIQPTTIKLTTEKVIETVPTEKVIVTEPETEATELTTEKLITTDKVEDTTFESTEKIQITTDIDTTIEDKITTIEVTEKEALKPITEADTSEADVTFTTTDYPPFATWSSNSDATKAPEKVTETPTTTEETWSPITPPEGWILLSTIAPKPETTTKSETIAQPETTVANEPTTEQEPVTEPQPTTPQEITTQPTKISTFTIETSTVAKTTTTNKPTTEEVTKAPQPQRTTESTTVTEPTKITEPTKVTEITKVTEPTKITSTTEVTTVSDNEVTKPIQEFTVNVTLSPTVPTSTSSSNDTKESSTEGTTAAVETSTNATTVETTTEFVNMSDYKNVCGRRLWQAPTGRIVGGTKSGFGMWPWQISLRQYRTSTYLHKCGAALLNENWAITAAHCVEHVPPSELLVRLGEHDLANEDEPYGFAERRVQIVASHPHFDPATFEYDLALLRFYEPVTFQPNILPVCVPDDDDEYVGRTAYVTGWGRLFDEGPLPSVLQEVKVPVINNSACEAMYKVAGYNEHIPNIFICAGRAKGGTDSCEGDSGGPMVLPRKRDGRFVLGGIISWGIGCAEPNQPGVYTRISEFRDWINQILQF